MKEDGFRRYYQAIVEAEDRQKAFLKAVAEAESKGIILPQEVWTRTKQHKQR